MGPIDLSKYEQLKATGDLPSPKGVALAIIQMTLQQDVSLSDLARVVKTDPAFVGRLIRAANGANTIGRRPVVSVQDAMVYLGVPAVRSLALGFSLMSNHAGGMCRSFAYAQYWSSCLACGIAMQAITARTRAARAEETFSLGLLARIGELALATLYPAAYASVLDNCRKFPDLDLTSLEQAAFAMNHRELSAAMLADWNVPKPFVDPVFHHEEVGETAICTDTRQGVLTVSLALARHIAAVCVAAPGARPGMIADLDALARRLPLDGEDIGEMCDTIVSEWQDWARLLEVDSGEVEPFADLRAAAEGRAADSGEGEGNESQPLRILVVGATGEARDCLRGTLAGLRAQAVEVDAGADALARVLEISPHIALLDWKTVGSAGPGLVRALRATRAGRGMLVMILVEREHEDDLVAAFESGVDAYLVKPLAPRVLAARLRAGRRVIEMQGEIERDREEIRYFAAELAVTNRRLQEVALTDSLTGLPNRRFAMDRLRQEWAASSRSCRPIACMVIDVDNFKNINDSYGHDVGDAALKATAAAFRKALRSQDVVCRVGGDEFLVICPDTGLDAALVCAERMRRAVAQAPIQAGAKKLNASLSVGVAVREPGMRDPDALMKSADRGVYAAKQRGKNKVGTVQKPAH
ncbi:MAG: hypothetical protein Fur0039_20580 [Rhodocyclaceae bacterium]